MRRRNFDFEEYKERLKQIGSWEPQIVDLVERLPNPWISSIDNSQAIYLNIAQVTVAGVLLSKKATSTFIFNFQNNIFELISLPVRFIFEIWATAYFSRNLVSNFIETFNEEQLKVLIDHFKDKQLRRRLALGKEYDDLAQQLNTTQNRLALLRKYFRITRGSRIKLEYPWGEHTEFTSINILDMVDSLNKIYPHKRKLYDFLCESCHPNFFQLANWNQFSLPNSQLIDQTIQALEEALEGISNEVITILETVIPKIEG